MAQQQAQMHCRLCQRPTLHTKVTQEPQHIIHFLISLFLCGCWIPIWIMLALQASSAAAAEPFRCSQCGQAYGDLTPHELGAMVAAKERDREERKKNRQARAAEMKRLLAEAVANVWSQIRGLSLAAGPFAVSLPNRADRALAAIAGDGNTIVHGFLRALAICGVAMMAVVAMIAAISLLRA